MPQVKKRKTQKKRKLSLNVMLWLVVVSIIFLLILSNFKKISEIISNLSSKEQGTKLQNNNDPSTTENTKTDEAEHQKDLEKTEEKPADDTQENNDEELQSTISSHVYFVKIHDDGSFYLIKKTRSIKKTQAVLTKTLAVLFQGTTPEEERNGIKSFIPEKSVVKSAVVKNGIAYINISDDFQFNTFGPTALEAQVYQIIYTSTEFPTIDKVQILINGQKISYLSGEGGLSLAEPISRQDLSSAR